MCLPAIGRGARGEVARLGKHRLGRDARGGLHRRGRGTDGDAALGEGHAGAAEREPRCAEAEHKRRELEASEGEEAEIEVVDILREPLRTLVEGVLVTPTLVRLSPPVRHIVGDPSDRAIVLRALGLDGKAK